MKRNWRRILSLILAAAMILTMNTQAFAADAVSADAAAAADMTAVSNDDAVSADDAVSENETQTVSEPETDDATEAVITAEAAGSSVDWKPAADWKVLSSMGETISGASVSYNTDAEGKMTLLVNCKANCIIVYSGSVEVTATVTDISSEYQNNMYVSNNSVCPLCLTKGFKAGFLKWRNTTIYVSDNKYLRQPTHW